MEFRLNSKAQNLLQKIKEKLNDRLGEKLIDDLFFQIGSVQANKDSLTNQPSREWVELSLTEKELSEVENSLKELKDPDLSSILKRILINQKKRIRYFRGE